MRTQRLTKAKSLLGSSHRTGVLVCTLLSGSPLSRTQCSISVGRGVRALGSAGREKWGKAGLPVQVGCFPTHFLLPGGDV